MSAPPSKICASCGREFAWRAKWRANWDEVRYCSQACRRRRVGDLDRRLEQALLRGLRDGEIDPDDVARDLAGGADPAALREPARRAARRLVAAGAARMVQCGREVDPSRVRGRVLLRRVPGSP